MPLGFKQPYCDYPTYVNDMPHYSARDSLPLDEANFDRWAFKASYMVDKLTYGRAPKYRDILQSELAYACASIAEILARAETGKTAAASGLSGASNDGYSESYAAGKGITATINKLCYDALEDALGADPYGLLYAGVI